MEQKLSFPIICLTLLLCSLPTESQIQMSINPSQVVLGSSSPVSTTFTCTISGSTNILDILFMQLLRKRKTDMDFVAVGQVKVQDPANAAFVPTAPQDIVSRGSMSGGIDVNTPTSSTLTLTLSTQDLVCADKGEYQCMMVYLHAYGYVISVQNNGTLSIYDQEPTTTERAETLTNVTNKGEESGVDVVIG